jgi:hypothetical protein
VRYFFTKIRLESVRIASAGPVGRCGRPPVANPDGVPLAPPRQSESRPC